MTSIVWLRRDLRLADNPALSAAAKLGPVLPVYILESDLPRPLGGASLWWLHYSLAALGRELARLGLPLLLLKGSAAELLPKLAAQTQAQRVLCNDCHHPTDGAVKRALAPLPLETVFDHLLYEPGAVRTQGGQPFKVFTPFWRAVIAQPEPPRPLPVPSLSGVQGIPGDALEDWHLLPTTPDWAGGLRESWTPGEAGAQERLDDFLDGGLNGYSRDRDFPAKPATSRLSPHLAFGEISPRQIWHAARLAGVHPAEGFLRELGWREFCHHMLRLFPDMATRPVKPEFAAFPWREDDEQWLAFIQGRTGYPIVDAGLRELWHTGFMHNRVRMIVASFLVKDLLIPWQKGEDWFWDTLVDADPANNPCGWQWVAGCGFDAAPYFRIFNPVLQSQKFDPDGRYIRRWCPELARLPDKHLHAPWTAPMFVRDYPAPVVDHDGARQRALAALKSI